MHERAEHTVLYIKYVSDALAEQGASSIEGVTSGISLRILARTEADGRTSVAASLYKRVHRMRASGKVFHYWTSEVLTSLARTKKDLLVLRSIDRRSGRSTSEHVFDPEELDHWIYPLSAQLQEWMRRNQQARRLEGPAPEEVADAIVKAIEDIHEHMGDLPTWAERFPLLPVRPNRPAYQYLPYLDARDEAQVAKNLFGIRSYRRPLAREVQRLDIGTLSWFALFRGLVPIEWIIEAMAATKTVKPLSGQRQHSHISRHRRGIRAILRLTPQPVLRRILKEPLGQAQRTLVDAADSTAHQLGVTRDLGLLPDIIAARGQRRIRNSRDLEQLVRGLPQIERLHNPRIRSTQRTMQNEIYSLHEMERYNREVQLLPAGTAAVASWELWRDDAFRQQALSLLEERRLELMTARERERREQHEARRLERIAKQAQRHQWAIETTALLDGHVIAPGMRLVVARDAATLTQWGAALNNCIGGYARDLELDVFLAVCDAAGDVRLNLQITQAHGVEQILGKNNRDAVRELGDAAQQVVDGLTGLGIPFQDEALGTRGLRVPAASL